MHFCEWQYHQLHTGWSHIGASTHAGVINKQAVAQIPFFTLSKTFLIPAAGGIPGALKTRPLGPAENGIQSAYPPLR